MSRMSSYKQKNAKNKQRKQKPGPPDFHNYSEKELLQKSARALRRIKGKAFKAGRHDLVEKILRIQTGNRELRQRDKVAKGPRGPKFQQLTNPKKTVDYTFCLWSSLLGVKLNALPFTKVTREIFRMKLYPNKQMVIGHKCVMTLLPLRCLIPETGYTILSVTVDSTPRRNSLIHISGSRQVHSYENENVVTKLINYQGTISGKGWYQTKYGLGSKVVLSTTDTIDVMIAVGLSRPLMRPLRTFGSFFPLRKAFQLLDFKKDTATVFSFLPISDTTEFNLKTSVKLVFKLVDDALPEEDSLPYWDDEDSPTLNEEQKLNDNQGPNKVQLPAPELRKIKRLRRGQQYSENVWEFYSRQHNNRLSFSLKDPNNGAILKLSLQKFLELDGLQVSV